MVRKHEMGIMKYYTIESDEAEEELMVVGKVDKGINVLIHIFDKEEKEAARQLINSMAQSPSYLWDLQGETKMLRSYIKEIRKKKKTGKPIPFYYAVLMDGEEFPLVRAQNK